MNSRKARVENMPPLQSEYIKLQDIQNKRGEERKIDMNHHMKNNPLRIMEIDKNMFHEVKKSDLIDDIDKYITTIFIAIQ